jgi:hypothetical protein
LRSAEPGVVGRGLILVIVDGHPWPLSASFRAIPRPMPRELPVIKACLPLNDIIYLLLFVLDFNEVVYHWVELFNVTPNG